MHSVDTAVDLSGIVRDVYMSRHKAQYRVQMNEHAVVGGCLLIGGWLFLISSFPTSGHR